MVSEVLKPAARIIREERTSLALGLSASGIVVAVMEPWIALPAAISTLFASTSVATYRQIKKGIEEKMPEGEVWQRPYKLKLAVSKALLVGSSISIAGTVGFGLLDNVTVPGYVQYELYDGIHKADMAGQMKRGQPFNVPVGDRNYSVTIERTEPYEDGRPTDKIYEGETTFVPRPVFKWQKPGRITRDISLDPRSGMPPGPFGAPPPPRPE